LQTICRYFPEKALCVREKMRTVFDSSMLRGIAALKSHFFRQCNDFAVTIF